MCLVGCALIVGPRLVMFVWWLADMARWAATFDAPFLPRAAAGSHGEPGRRLRYACPRAAVRKRRW
jgi:hypothetical protein